MKIKQSLKKQLFVNMRTAILAISAFILGQQALLAQTIDCNAGGRAYVLGTSAEANGRQYLYSVPLNSDGTLNSSNLVVVKDLGLTTYNALGYYAGSLYAVNGTGAVFQIDAAGNITSVTVADPNSLLGAGYTAGDATAGGVYYIFNPSSKMLVSINLTGGTPTATLVADLTTALGTAGVTGSIDDIVVHPSNGNLYAVTSGSELIEITPAGNVTLKATGTNLSGLPTGTKGTAFIDDNGNMYVGQNGGATGGNVYKIGNPTTGTSWPTTLLASPLVYLSEQSITPVDGARCISSVAPFAKNDDQELFDMSAVTINVINGKSDRNGNNSAKDVQGTYPVTTTSTVLYDNQTGGTANNTITVPNKGTFVVQPNGSVRFTPLPGFTGEAAVWYTIKDNQSNESNRATITVWVADGTTLPVDFGAITATLINGQLVVNWSTLTETNNSYFEIEASKDGENFYKIGTVNTKAKDGNSDVSISYDFNIDLQSGNTLLGIAIFSIAFVALLFSRKNKWLYTVVLVGGLSIFGASSCSKNDAADIDASGKLFVRVKQVDKDGSFSYSKPVQVVKK
ncbi:Ig-like domain-containing protein [Niabella aquatica]